MMVGELQRIQQEAGSEWIDDCGGFQTACDVTGQKTWMT
jgi:hypothetical protein